MAAPTLTLASEASDKHFMYLVRGVIGKIVQHHPDATLAALRGLLDESGLDSAGKDALLLSLERVLSLAVVERWDVEKLQSFLAETDISAAHAGVLAAQWPRELSRATAVLSLRSKWEDTILDMSWRIDVLTSTKAGSAEDLSEPVAMVELSVGPVRGSPSVTTCLRRTPHPRLPSQRPESALTQHGHAAQTSAASSRAAPSSKKAHSASAVSHSSRDATSDAPSSSALRFEATREQLQALLGQMAAAEAAIQNLGGGATA